MTDKQPEALIRADELEAIGAESSLARAMAAHTIRLLHKENEALRARLAQPEPLPAKSKSALSHEENKQHNKKILDKFYEENAHLYTAPPQREWQGLTEYEVGFLTVFDGLHDVEVPLLANFIRHIEAKLKEKNDG
jgi:hypothetical protein